MELGREQNQHTPHLLSLLGVFICVFETESLYVLIVLELSVKKDQAGLECRALCLPLSIGIKSVSHHIWPSVSFHVSVSA